MRRCVSDPARDPHQGGSCACVRQHRLPRHRLALFDLLARSSATRNLTTPTVRGPSHSPLATSVPKSPDSSPHPLVSAHPSSAGIFPEVSNDRDPSPDRSGRVERQGIFEERDLSPVPPRIPLPSSERKSRISIQHVPRLSLGEHYILPRAIRCGGGLVDGRTEGILIGCTALPPFPCPSRLCFPNVDALRSG
jgi:hypothetical protein